MESESNSRRFEEDYPRFEFAPLVTMAISLARRIKKFSSSKQERLYGKDAEQPTDLSQANPG